MATDNGVNLSRQHPDEEKRVTIPIIEEHLQVEKKVVETGKVNISKTVHEETDQYNIPLTEQHVSVERIAKNEYLDVMPEAVRYEGDVMIIPVLKEVAVIEKKILLVEELRVTRVQSQRNETHEVTLRKEEIEVKRTEINKPL
ncbi:DUF2382 domain-containing protein [Segetibacter sp. 3557_3]|uniref:YsnF/AvaK domain-containing protein n=1 Tax=Segetibacter sp. 3557_3 TaxID=2547429 RepID=UPI001058E97E|nr:YsnF/AvaK domain-containing protein [Segetibacter sp. 3557_3]TDH21435.1 DUF2382 domain-containing protein [Segetibacter sp. 3557_3]